MDRLKKALRDDTRSDPYDNLSPTRGQLNALILGTLFGVGIMLTLLALSVVFSI